MSDILISDVLRRGLERRSERWCLAGCISLVIVYLVAFCWFQHADRRFDFDVLARRQAVRLARLAADPIVPGVVLRVSQNGQVARQLALLDGWSVPEAWGVWTSGPVAGMALALPQHLPLPATLEIWAYVAPGPGGHQDVSIESGDRPLGRWHLACGKVLLSVPIPAGIARPSGLLRLGLRIAYPVGKADDSRPLGLGVYQVAILPGRGAAPAAALCL